jgi:hypothetical protein
MDGFVCLIYVACYLTSNFRLLVVGAATSQRLFFFLSQLTLSQEHTHHGHTRTHTSQGRGQGFAKEHSLGANRGYIFLSFSLLK